MSEFRRNILLLGGGDKPLVPEYIESGLIALFDGINNTGIGHNSSSAVWKDLTGNGYDMSIIGQSALENSSLSWKATCLNEKTVDGILLNAFKSTKTFTPNKNPFTFECVYRVNNASSAVDTHVVCLMNPGGGHDQGYFTFGYHHSGNCACSFQQEGNNINTRDSHIMCNVGSIMYLSLLKPQGIMSNNNVTVYYAGNSYNGFTFNQYSQAPYASPQNLSFSTNWTNHTLPYTYSDNRDVDIYSIRLYNRRLTDAEVLANYAVDINRF